MRSVLRLFAVALVGITTFGGMVHAAEAPSQPPAHTKEPLSVALRASDRVLEPNIVYRHGDISWLPQLAEQAGWPQHTWAKLGHIILRESGGCPGRIGGSIVSPDCVIIGWDNSPPHKSDSGLLQLNGVHWKIDHPQYHGLICKQMGICEQEKLLDALTNLRAGKLLWDVAGFKPWTPTK